MQEDQDDRLSASERGWTPPPKGYAEDIAKSESGDS